MGDITYGDIINNMFVNGKPIQEITTFIENIKNKEENKVKPTEYEQVGVIKILKIYKERECEYIEEEYLTARREIIEKDKIHSIYVEYANKIKEAYEKEWKKEMPFEIYAGESVLTQKTEEKLREIEEENRTNKINLSEKLEEVEARLEMTNDYDKQIEILKTYDILNEEGMINA